MNSHQNPKIGELEQLGRQKREFIARKEWSKALALVEQMLAITPTAELFNQKGAVLLQMQRYAEAQACFQRAKQLSSGQPPASSAGGNLGSKPPTQSGELEDERLASDITMASGDERLASDITMASGAERLASDITMASGDERLASDITMASGEAEKSWDQGNLGSQQDMTMAESEHDQFVSDATIASVQPGDLHNLQPPEHDRGTIGSQQDMTMAESEHDQFVSDATIATVQPSDLQNLQPPERDMGMDAPEEAPSASGITVVTSKHLAQDLAQENIGNTPQDTLGEVLAKDKKNLESLFDDRRQTFGRYQILAELGRGGMGKVYRAVDPELKREVALKTMLSGGDAHLEQRFLKEAEAMARLSHANIVKVYDMGTIANTHYFTMELIRGKNLSDLVHESKMSVRRAAEIVRKVAEAIDYAHDQGILHRDLKPSNIMVDEQDEPKVMDFGLAMEMEGDSRLSKSGSVIGTPAYMPPEQAMGKRKEMDERSDVYSLGAVLYELLTGVPPFRGQTSHVIIAQLLNKEPVPPTQISKKVSKEVENICLKAMSKEKRRRYQTAREMALDLGRFIAGEPVLAMKAGTFYKMKKWFVKNPLVAGITGLFLTILASAGIYSVWQIRQAYQIVLQERDNVKKERDNAQKERDNAQKERDNAREARLEAIRDRDEARQARDIADHAKQESVQQKSVAISYLIRSYIQQADSAWREGRHQYAALLYALALPKETEDNLASEIRNIARVRLAHRFPELGANVVSVELDCPVIDQAICVPDEKTILVATRDKHSDIDNHIMRIRLGDGPGQHHLEEIVGRSEHMSPTFTADGQWVAMGGSDENIVIINLLTKQVLHNIQGHLLLINCIRFHRQGNLLVSASNDGEVRIWNTVSGKMEAELKKHKEEEVISTVAFNVTGDTIAIARANNDISLWDWKTNQIYATLTGHSDTIFALVFSPDGKYLASGGDDGTIRLWELKKRQNSYSSMVLKGHMDEILSLDFHPRGDILASGSNDATIRLWDVKTGDNLAVLEGHGGQVNTVVFTKTGKLISGGDKKVRVWDIGQMRHAQLLEWHSQDVESVAVSPDGKTIASGSKDKFLQLWEAKSDRPGDFEPKFGLKKFPPRVDGKITTVDFCTQGNLFAFGSTDHHVQLWGIPAKRLAGFKLDKPVRSVAFSPNGKTLAIGTEFHPRHQRGGEIVLWDVRSQKIETTLPLPFINVWSVAFDPSGRWLAAGVSNGIKVWEVGSRQLVKDIPIPGGGNVYCLVFAPDGSVVASAHEDNHVRLWNPATWEAVGILKGHLGQVKCLAFAPQAEFLEAGNFILASGSLDQTIRVWDVKRQELGNIFRGNLGGINGLAFTPDGKTLVSGSDDNVIRLWPILLDKRFLTEPATALLQAVEQKTQFGINPEDLSMVYKGK